MALDKSINGVFGRCTIKEDDVKGRYEEYLLFVSNVSAYARFRKPQNQLSFFFSLPLAIKVAPLRVGSLHALWDFGIPWTITQGQRADGIARTEAILLLSMFPPASSIAVLSRVTD
jgi:hypothetical protein